MNKQTAESNLIDFIGRDEEIKILTNVLTSEYKFEEESYVLSLNAKFGDGKTTFLTQWEKYLKDNDYRSKTGFVTPS